MLINIEKKLNKRKFKTKNQGFDFALLLVKMLVKFVPHLILHLMLQGSIRTVVERQKVKKR